MTYHPPVQEAPGETVDCPDFENDTVLSKNGTCLLCGEQVQQTVAFRFPKHPTGTKFIYRSGSRSKYEATIIGYHVVHDTDTGGTNVTYRIEYVFAGQSMKASVPRSTVDRALLNKEQ